MTIDPQTISVFPATGSGDIDCSFGLSASIFSVAFCRIHFLKVAGASTSTNPLYISVRDIDPNHCAMLLTKTSVGYSSDGSGDVSIRFDDLEASRLLFFPNQKVRFQWTNPDPPNHQWGLKVGLVASWQ